MIADRRTRAGGRIRAGLARLVLAATIAAAPAAAGPGRALAWEDLKPPTPPIDDPFAGLSDEQHNLLAAIVRSRVLEARGFPVTDEARRLRGEYERRLASQGIRADEHLARRDAIIAGRTAAAEAGVDALDGTRVKLGGYLLPVSIDAGRVTEFLLVPWVGACSHMPAPPPNQVVRVRPVRPYPAREVYEAVDVDGVLRVRIEEREVYALDGRVSVRTTYAVDDAGVRAAGDTGTAL